MKVRLLPAVAIFLAALGTGATSLASQRQAAVESEQRNAHYDLNNQPPRIIFSTRPAILVLIDGEPVLRPLGQDGLQRVVNTRALLVYHPQKSAYYLALMDGWVQAATPEGPWTYADSVPSEVSNARDAFASSDQIDLLNDGESTRSKPGEGAREKSEPLKARLKDGSFPVIYVNTSPTELLIAKGEPQLTAIQGTRLLYVSNTDGDIFMNTADQAYYILISGRWFRARSMDGPWQYVAGKELPGDFARIPEGHAKASVLASVPGTRAAREAVIANSTPQMATITRSDARLNVRYDGSPQFRQIEGTGLKYAGNSPTPVIESGGRFFAVQDGVWFEADSPPGPWSVATSVPAEIYSIPPSSPVHYVTYVRIYGYTPEVVYCGYTPGYYGTVVSIDDVVVYGTGWYYPPYIGAYWIGWPWTYGCGAGFGWSPWWGWCFDFGIGYYFPFWRPWWGPFAWGFGSRHLWPGWGWGRFGSVAALNVYGRWGRSAFIRTRPVWATPRATDTVGGRFGRTGTTGPMPRFQTRPGNPVPPRGVQPQGRPWGVRPGSPFGAGRVGGRSGGRR